LADILAVILYKNEPEKNAKTIRSSKRKHLWRKVPGENIAF